MNLQIPTLIEVLTAITEIPLVIDMKSTPEKPLVKALISHIPEKEWNRLIFYSTNPEHLDLLKQVRPDAIVFEPRKMTRMRLLNVMNNDHCDRPSSARWIGFELERKMTVLEKLTLGDDSDEINFELWNKKSVSCTRKMAPHAKIVFFGINTIDNLKIVEELKVDAVYTDNPVLLMKKNE